MRRFWVPVVTAVVCATALVGCKPSVPGEVADGPSDVGPSAVASSSAGKATTEKLTLAGAATETPGVTPTRTTTPLPRRSPAKILSTTLPAKSERGVVLPQVPKFEVPQHGAGTFTIAGGGSGVVGAGETLVKYQVELEQGISWGTVPPWTAASFAAAVDGILANERGWIASAAHPVTDADEGMSNESWSFQRVSDGSYGVRVRLATPATVDKLCGSAGVDTEGVYSCRYGKNILINLGRWLYGAVGFRDMAAYRQMVISHEMGHFLGFNHMLCPGAGQLAPVMQTQTIALDGCLPNPYPFTVDGRFVMGPWAPS
ncbi:hypothetical protein HDA40_003137 [Hamadaea flava]|uniref:DUF3152 domain-containing protein n=1 Tax=Hamadaea flava TaxID=1742688 RepID=A0ABV8LWL1_9ACTN|nr:DUF3152 domain-containing protein [Hamadaea flava]MCP2324630.1 hypothetical protein [Hamadaea flava]